MCIYLLVRHFYISTLYQQMAFEPVLAEAH